MIVSSNTSEYISVVLTDVWPKEFFWTVVIGTPWWNQESGTSVSAGMVGELLADMRHSSQFLQRSVGVGIAEPNAASCSMLSYFRIMPSAFR